MAGKAEQKRTMPLEPLLTAEQTAELLNVPKRTLDDWRVQGIGPHHITLGPRLTIMHRQIRSRVDIFWTHCRMAAISLV